MAVERAQAMNRTVAQTCAESRRRLRRSFDRLIMLDFGVGLVSASIAAYTNMRFPNGGPPAFGVSIANIGRQGVRDLERVGVGARDAIAAALVWANQTRTKFVPLSSETSKAFGRNGGRRARVRVGPVRAADAVRPCRQIVIVTGPASGV
ncbi:hypothetical protein [Burkholderia contaminans]|uniref:hypothetical protein n=1 Tax=Burkholderia contaminans TaxID=488447 RepID=UPI003BF9B0AD